MELNIKMLVGILKSWLRLRSLRSLIALCVLYGIFSLGTTRLEDNAPLENPKRSEGRKPTGSLREVTSTSSSTPTKEPLEDIPINPPALDLHLWNVILNKKEVDLNLLSDLIQKQIRDVQSNCSGRTLKCGHYYEGCGLTCQIHQRVACLMTSYALSVPLIHDEIEGWPFSQKWSDLFLPLGSNCSEGPRTIYWTRNKTVLCNIFALHHTRNHHGFKDLSPVLDGILVVEPLAKFLNKNLIHPSQWLVGQFIKFGLKLNPQTERDIKRDMATINFQRPIIGFHIRRTDKITEMPDSHHKIEEYMIQAEKYFQKLLNLTTLSRKPPTRTVFIASDDAATVILEAQKKYRNWTVLGFPSQPTLKKWWDRRDAVYDVVRDTFILSECDYVICGMSSNVCRLLLEMLSYKYPNGYDLLHSLDHYYFYPIDHKRVAPLGVVSPTGNPFLQRLTG